ncbi:hypothetical protein AXX17_AT1G62940 [Arabidopsis thaliana]|uniref:Uncharacterized protein n=1 Tax=Arabidopsis thaliana TaxID=3702 RepID=A0A178WFC9_ARATH|nr:hypothetical protein AXX17_AT1G62940 [Arabidopsis thaliana]
MISHRKCEKVAKQRCLTRAGLKRYDSQRVGKGLSVKSHYSQSYVDMGLLFEETLTYAQFMVEVRVDVVYASEHEWGGKKLIRSLLVNLTSGEVDDRGQGQHRPWTSGSLNEAEEDLFKAEMGSSVVHVEKKGMCLALTWICLAHVVYVKKISFLGWKQPLLLLVLMFSILSALKTGCNNLKIVHFVVSCFQYQVREIES